MLSQLEKLRKKLKGGSKATRDQYHKALVAHLAELKNARQERTNYIASSCREFGEEWEELPETQGFLESLLSKGGHKDVVKAVVYDPATNDLKTCVDMKTFHAAKEWQQNTQGILDMKQDFSDLAVALPALMKAVNTLMDAAGPFVVGSPTHPAKSVRGKDKEVVMVKGADGQQHPINTCEASISEEECQSKTDTYGGEQACIWMPSQTSHVREQMAEWFDQSGNPGVGELQKLEAKVCVPKIEFPLPLRDATEVDIAALRLGKQLVNNKKQAMKPGGSMSQLRAASIGNTEFHNRTGHYKDAYPGARKTRKIGSRVFPMQVPYVREVRKDTNGTMGIHPVEKKKTVTSGIAEAAARSIQRNLTNIMFKKRLPQRARAKIKKINDKMTALKAKYKAELMSSDIAANQIDAAVYEKVKQDPNFIHPEEINDYAIYQIASATKEDGSPVLSQDELNQLLSANGAGNDMIRVNTSGANLNNILKNTNYQDEIEFLLKKSDGKYVERVGKDTPKQTKWHSTGNAVGNIGTLQQFLVGGGIPYEHPPADSAIGQRSFAMINEGPLYGGDLSWNEWREGRGEEDDKGTAKKRARRNKSLVLDESEGDKDTRDQFKNDVTQAGDHPAGRGSYQFILNPTELIVLKAALKNNNKLLPMIRKFYEKRAQDLGTKSAEVDTNWVFANEERDVRGLMYLMANLTKGDESIPATHPGTEQNPSATAAASAILRFPTPEQQKLMVAKKRGAEAKDADASELKTDAEKSSRKAGGYSYNFPLFFNDKDILAKLATKKAEGQGGTLLHYLIGAGKESQKFVSWRAGLSNSDLRAAVGSPYNEAKLDDKTQFPAYAGFPTVAEWAAIVREGIEAPPVKYSAKVTAVDANKKTLTLRDALPTTVAKFMLLGTGQVVSSHTKDTNTIVLNDEWNGNVGDEIQLGDEDTALAVSKWNAYQTAKGDATFQKQFRDLRAIAEIAVDKYKRRMANQSNLRPLREGFKKNGTLVRHDLSKALQ